MSTKDMYKYIDSFIHNSLKLEKTACLLTSLINCGIFIHRKEQITDTQQHGCISTMLHK